MTPTGKPRMELLPPELLTEVARALSLNVDKHGARDWEQGRPWGKTFGSLMRHLWAWWNPFEPDVDAETGLSHLAHAGAQLAFLIAYESRGTGEDDRPG